ncbi:predicted protein [Naegleria gruberi]|uniref:Predicted protein n=1 Tax=Naegleria gruberi TaxID=5762 RepID=D2W384_NAEGR|nr:uncharacterized protein NAEGRDRAFT_75854 [Naegleria gruberi]EFC36470.1 predicted protein [Naegleria gruberi]|eukprot:XP_002669214.1 predicted protein [Naegleria gruberi strain NEG-M]
MDYSNLFQSSSSSSNNNNNQHHMMMTCNNSSSIESLFDSMLDEDELDFSAVMREELESHEALNHPLSPPTVIIPSTTQASSSSASSSAVAHNIVVVTPHTKSNVLLAGCGEDAAVDRTMMMYPSTSFCNTTSQSYVNNHQTQQQQHSPSTPRLSLDTNSVFELWQQFINNNNNPNNTSTTTPINNNNNLNLNNNININNNNNNSCNNNVNTTSIEQQVQELLNQLAISNNTNPNNHNTLNISTPTIMTNNNNNNTMLINNNSPSITNNNQSQQVAYLGSMLANCTNIQSLSPSMRRSIHHHSKSPSLGSINSSSSSSSQSRGIRKGGSHQRSTSCFQAIQSYSNSKMQSCGANNMLMVNNMNGGLNSPSVTSTCSSNMSMSPANVSTNSFGNSIMMNNSNGQVYMSNNNNTTTTVGQQVVVNQHSANNSNNSSNKKGKIPANRQDKNNHNQFTFVNQQHSKGLLVEANPNDKPIKMQQCKLVDGGIKIQIEDGISKNKKDTGLQFHTCTFK